MGSLGGGFHGHQDAEALKLADEAPLLFLGVDAPLEVVVAELLVGASLAQDVPDDDQDGVGQGEDGLVLALLPEAPEEALVLGRQVGVLGMGGSPGRLAEEGLQRG